VMGMEGFVGMESILYHLQSLCRVLKIGGFEEIKRDEWVPDTHAHRHFMTYDIDAEGDEITGRRLLMWNDDVEISLARPKDKMDYFFRTGKAARVASATEGPATSKPTSATFPTRRATSTSSRGGTPTPSSPRGS